MPMFFIDPLWRRVAATLALLLSSIPAQAAQPVIRPSGYTLVVNLTPAMCALNPALKRLRQCQEGFSLTISSLQPQLPKGQVSENCSQEQAALPPLQERIVERVMPDEQLRNNDWQRTGSCTGMTARTYFRTIATFADRLRVPPEFNTDSQLWVDRQKLIGQLMDLNSGLKADGLQLRCAVNPKSDAPVLTEMRVCYSLNGQYAHCPDTVHSNCPVRFVVQGSP
jgi:ribonuclease T2